eukprot:TRINITY_DN669_c1_g1_i3.p1 TRINITY_DN669_c1_g1~~TRINITY_DN669_c1_g1_i3.p1  ORF type:complete len:411 (-),score=102.78 TRINITY_DN669_c1_g1_i3:45-1277(-)
MDPNEIAGKIMRARITGKGEQADKMQEILDSIKSGSALGLGGTAVVLPDIDASGRSRRALRDEKEGEGNHHKGRKRTLQSHTSKEGKEKKGRYGERDRYYKDDDVDLKELMLREKRGGEDYDKNYIRNITGNSRYKHNTMEPDFDDDYVNLDAYENRDKHRSKEQLEEKRRKSAINDYNKQSAIEANCYYCFNNKKVPKHLIMALGNAAYLMLKPKGLVPGHCVIVPIEHHSGGFVSIDENVWEEIQNFMKSVVKMNYQSSCGTVFMETQMPKHEADGVHSVIECVPVPAEMAGSAYGYFKKAINESESNWSQHKKIIETHKKGGLRHSIPEGFPFFYVQFGMTQGMVHIIENGIKFPIDFGEQVLAGLLELHDRYSSGRIKRKSFDEEAKEAKEFLGKYLKFDWTADLD